VSKKQSTDSSKVESTDSAVSDSEGCSAAEAKKAALAVAEALDHLRYPCNRGELPRFQHCPINTTLQLNEDAPGGGERERESDSARERERAKSCLRCPPPVLVQAERRRPPSCFRHAVPRPRKADAGAREETFQAGRSICACDTHSARMSMNYKKIIAIFFS